MPTFDAGTVALLLQASSLGQARAAAIALEGLPALQADAFDVHAVGLGRTYGVRLSNLRSKSSPYARQLAASVAELCDNLRTFRGEACWLAIPGPGSTKFLLLVTADVTRVLGCMVLVSKLHVTDAECAGLWEDERQNKGT